MNYSDKTLLVLDQIKKQDDSILACFAFGSFVTEETSPKNYREIRIFDGSDFIMSKFNLTNIYPDIDIICISSNPDKTAKLFNKNFNDVFAHFVTINIMNQEVFEREVFSREPAAIKRILLYRKLLVVKGEDYLEKIKKEVEKIESSIDLIFQKEFNFRKEYFRLFSKYDVNSVTITKNDYKHLFPNIYKYITGVLHAGFPEDRIKLIYPKSMNLKAKLDISESNIIEII